MGLFKVEIQSITSSSKSGSATANCTKGSEAIFAIQQNGLLKVFSVFTRYAGEALNVLFLAEERQGILIYVN